MSKGAAPGAARRYLKSELREGIYNYPEAKALFFSPDQLKQIQDEYDTISGKYQRLLLNYSRRTYANSFAQEFAMQGFVRRLGILVRCIDNIFSILPPDRTAVPTDEERWDAIINAQASVFNIFGCTDNLAWIWVYEKNLMTDDGSPVPAHWVGLRKNNTLVRTSFSQQFQDYLASLDGWFDNLENFRHALAHRIPLYIPPYNVPPNNLASYQDLERQIQDAILRLDFDERDRLLSEKNRLCTFVPIMTHSFRARKVVFHAQSLADFNTIDELSGKLLEELSR